MKLGLKTALSAALAVSLSACAATNGTEALTDAAQNDLRSEQAKSRDQYRHPVETLAFFGFEPSMTVVEIWPGGGWYSDIIAPAMKGEGTFYAAHFPADSDVEYYQRSLTRFQDKLASDSAYSDVKLSEFAPGTHHSIAPEGSADMVLTFRNLHNWYMQKDEQGVKDAFKAFYAALKPGGVLGVVDHRLPESRDAGKAKRSGYVKESWVIELAKQAGFELAAKSEINANPNDFADHPRGVWTLPPRLALGDEDRAKYEAIGESDRMTLKFIKPQ
ncbi:methyltransferase [Pseudoalteromonas sp. CO325X]|uniref:class I SAM-dependent methyltransferase n=1 Tax=Pseudoalteromonas TaxID=53246 RepID=UPI000348CA84|nr:MULTISPECIES: class I SAM-dependent methyltransferase [Pseudoalteromonas]RZF77846.1 methyltransferase [Pseudoalteromonas sp. CO325X]|tara:strand:+ start:214 stop:1035 length:822 start_codon:yes stop_codon:yes gene_type:complete